MIDVENSIGKKIKFFIIKIVFIFGYIFGNLFRYKFLKKLKFLLSVFYTGQLVNEFKSFGKESIIFRSIELYGGKNISIGNKVLLGKNVVLTAWKVYNGKHYQPEIKIGDSCSIGDFCHITSINRITIGNNVLIGKFVTITDHNHGEISKSAISVSPRDRALISKGYVEIKDRVWIGDKATILSGVSIGESSIVAANSVISKDVPPYSVIGGNNILLKNLVDK